MMSDVNLKEEDTTTTIHHQHHEGSPPSPPPPAPEAQADPHKRHWLPGKHKKAAEHHDGEPAAPKKPIQLPNSPHVYTGFCAAEIFLGTLVLICISPIGTISGSIVHATCIGGILLGIARLYFHILAHYHVHHTHFLSSVQSLSWLLSGVVLYGLWTILYLLSAAFETHYAVYADSLGLTYRGAPAAAFFCFVAIFVYGLGTAFYFLQYRRSLAGHSQNQPGHLSPA